MYLVSHIQLDTKSICLKKSSLKFWELREKQAVERKGNYSSENMTMIYICS